jgi:hypothetical protein
MRLAAVSEVAAEFTSLKEHDMGMNGRGIPPGFAHFLCKASPPPSPPNL